MSKNTKNTPKRPIPSVQEIGSQLIESGRRSVSSIELARLAELYQRPVSFFLQTRDKHPAEEEALGVLLRADKPTALARRLGLTTEQGEEEHPFPLRFLCLALEAYRKEEISLGKFAALLHMSRQEETEVLKSLGIPLNLGVESKEELTRELKSA